MIYRSNLAHPPPGILIEDHQVAKGEYSPDSPESAIRHKLINKHGVYKWELDAIDAALDAALTPKYCDLSISYMVGRPIGVLLASSGLIEVYDGQSIRLSSALFSTAAALIATYAIVRSLLQRNSYGVGEHEVMDLEALVTQ
jgi:hypothetical protein